MPRKPTQHAREARAGLLARVRALPRHAPLPILADLAREYEMHPSTIFRLLRNLAEEGHVWQSPQGKFYAAASRQKALRGAPVCFIGREMWQWSRLYQEILEGVSEVCGANGSPLVLLSSRSLVFQTSPTDQPEFAPPAAQKKELRRLLGAIPRGCAGYLFDHLWHASALETPSFPSGEKVQLLWGDGKQAQVFAPDYALGANLVAEFLRLRNFRRIGLVLPFRGDPGIDGMGDHLRAALGGLAVTEISFSAHLPPSAVRLRKLDALVCTEDNVAEFLIEKNASGLPLLIATQGTGLLQAPHVRLRMDYRRLGRAAAAHILHGTTHAALAPALIVPE
ncbi:MAG: hypothetical protein IAE94_07845 [Chthoniobacterales bacterium]|nr:hypothetical protein [Chthoniobacterales bacterium]